MAMPTTMGNNGRAKVLTRKTTEVPTKQTNTPDIQILTNIGHRFGHRSGLAAILNVFALRVYFVFPQTVETLNTSGSRVCVYFAYVYIIS